MLIPTRKMKPLRSHTPDMTKASFALNFTPELEISRSRQGRIFGTSRGNKSPRDVHNSLLVNKTRGLQSKYQFKLKILTSGQKQSPERSKLLKSGEFDKTTSDDDTNERFVRYIAGYPKISKEKSFSRPAIGYLVDHPNICEFNSVVNSLKHKKESNLFYSFAKDPSVQTLKIDGHSKVNPNGIKLNHMLLNRELHLADTSSLTSRTNLPTDRKLEPLKAPDTARSFQIEKKDRSRSENTLTTLKIDSTKIDLKLSIAPKMENTTNPGSRDIQRLKPIRPTKTRPLKKPDGVKLSVMFDKQP